MTLRFSTAFVLFFSGLLLVLGSPRCQARVLQAASDQAVEGEQLRLPAGFKAERLYSVPKEQGSWVAMTTDPQGRLITSDQYGKLYRVSVTGAEFSVEPIDLSIGHAQGLLHAFGSLYVMAHGSEGRPAGLYRLQDRDNDDHVSH